jgi:hypothetical protein
MVNRVATTLLDAIGLLLLAAGFAAATFFVMEWACLAVAGAVVLIGSWWAAKEPKHEAKDVDE